MKHVFYVLLFIFTSLSATPSHAIENSARDDVCNLVSTLVNESSKAGLDKITEMFSWNESVADKASNALAILKNYQFEEGYAYIIADFDGLLEQYLIVMSANESGGLYMHLTFEKIQGKLVLINIDFNDSYVKLADKVGPFPLEPTNIDC